MSRTGVITHSTRADAEARAFSIGGHVEKVPGTASVWASFPADKVPSDLPNWFPSATARVTDPATSHAAASKAQLRAAGDRALVLRIHQQYTSGLTDFELAELADRQQTSLGVRRKELRVAGLIRDSGLKRPSPSGTPSTVWIITAEGRAAHPIELERKAS